MKYYCYRNKLELVTDSEDEVWSWIGKKWGCYEVLDENGYAIEKFIPF